jgi:hypothetical protein
MNKRLALGIMMSFAALLPARAHGQPVGQPAGLPGFLSSGLGSIFLLMNKGVVDEIQATEEQKTKLAAQTPGLLAKYRDARLKLKDAPDADKPAKMQEIAKELEALAAKELDAIFKPDQIKRLKQIERQQIIALTILRDEDVARNLKTGEEQRDRIKAINDESNASMTKIFLQMTKDNGEESQGKIASAIKEANERSLNELKEEQRQKWKEMIGKPFVVKMSEFNFALMLKKK